MENYDLWPTWLFPRESKKEKKNPRPSLSSSLLLLHNSLLLLDPAYACRKEGSFVVVAFFHPLCRLSAFSLLALPNYLLTDTAVSVICSTNQDSSLHPLHHVKTRELTYHLGASIFVAFSSFFFDWFSAVSTWKELFLLMDLGLMTGACAKLSFRLFLCKKKIRKR